MKIYRDRAEAGRVLTEALTACGCNTETVVLGIPRGGVVLAHEVSKKLGSKLDVMLVRKIGMPMQPELAIGAIASGNVRVFNEILVRQLGVNVEVMDEIITREQQELLRRQHMYMGNRPLTTLKDKQVLLVDDGLATGATMKAAILAVRQLGGREVIASAAVGAADTVRMLEKVADIIVCPQVPADFGSVSQWYDNFEQIHDQEVARLLSAKN
ncbi:phosphoribosyltransferase [Poriferisphaera sp. WC338]|uniref:phosphoribosyltransferase n=1 Tax=Poriferisphaera sp. WC338 TaxID=3425129 RepID=UPI003D81B51C